MIHPTTKYISERALLLLCASADMSGSAPLRLVVITFCFLDFIVNHNVHVLYDGLTRHTLLFACKLFHCEF